MPEKIIKQTLSEQIYNILKEDILSGRILMGDKLTNRELQERFQVSSTPVRDAINRLSKDGLTQEVSKSGAQLITFDYSYANELNDFITFLACRAVMLSSTEPDTEKLVEKLQMYEEEMAGAKTSMEYFEADFRYHKVFFDHCGNRFMKETYKQYNFIRTLLIRYAIFPYTTLFRSRYAIRTEDERDLGIRQHRGITQAFQKKDYEKARKLMEEHYLSGMQLAREHYREGDTFRENKK